MFVHEPPQTGYRAKADAILPVEMQQSFQAEERGTKATKANN
jgi:hypothetical protein